MTGERRREKRSSVFVLRCERVDRRLSAESFSSVDRPATPIVVLPTRFELQRDSNGEQRASGRKIDSTCPSIGLPFVQVSCLPELESSFNKLLLVGCLTEVFLAIVLLVLLVVLLLYLRSVPRAKLGLRRHNEFILHSIFSSNTTRKRTDGENVRLTKEKKRLRGVLPLSPTIIRVAKPPIQNYFGYE